MSVTLYCGECVEEMARMKACSVTTIITDPPYHLTQASRGGSKRENDPSTPFGRHRLSDKGFAGKSWDGGDVAFRPETWAAALRVAKPGTYLLAFGGSRTFHRLFCAIEDGGWVIMDTLAYLYGTGMPKALNIGKALDRSAGAVRTEVVGKYQPPGMTGPWNLKAATNGRAVGIFVSDRNNLDRLAPVTAEAKTWDGYFTALKPAYEPICLAMKPPDGSYAENALTHGVAGLNVDGCRIPLPGKEAKRGEGRWPANVILDETAASILDTQTGTLKSGTGAVKHASAKGSKKNALQTESRPEGSTWAEYGDAGGASRFFYCSKVSKAERGASDHPTMKPLDLMRWLCRLTKTPTGGVVLDPFCGSGSTLIAAALEGRNSIGIDADKHACDITVARCRERNIEYNFVEDSL